ncbi:hypothetical protein DS891_09360 [Pseudoalteromonas sp. JC28]|uniref:hypothetical protein n=1 Tax=unclassified Pseudoalteromonas TaxID=194690 RepID=UPI0015743AC2|nr:MULTISPECIES: hypothetical protein [unclassified Pseudoalteromonas]MCG7540239.1 hypothetical protein [Pseudoalteromonas sp. OF7H-1]NSY33791.1 hypothetical protein [Pseudoalteromonas sp. JC28]
MEYVLNIFDSPRLAITEIVFFTLLIAVIVANRKDGHRVYLVLVMFSTKLADLIIRPFLPWDVITFQFALFILNLLPVLLITYRLSIVSWVQKVTSLSFTVFNNNNTAKEQIAISYIYGFVAILCLGMIGEHILRHPELIGLSESLAIPIRLLYDSYPLIVTALTYLLILILFIMTIDGWAIRKMRAMEEKRNAKKRLG